VSIFAPQTRYKTEKEGWGKLWGKLRNDAQFNPLLPNLPHPGEIQGLFIPQDTGVVVRFCREKKETQCVNTTNPPIPHSSADSVSVREGGVNCEFTPPHL
jgi:hypothetical protein